MKSKQVHTSIVVCMQPRQVHTSIVVCTQSKQVHTIHKQVHTSIVVCAQLCLFLDSASFNFKDSADNEQWYRQRQGPLLAPAPPSLPPPPGPKAAGAAPLNAPPVPPPPMHPHTLQESIADLELTVRDLRDVHGSFLAQLDQKVDEQKEKHASLIKEVDGALCEIEKKITTVRTSYMDHESNLHVDVMIEFVLI